jgi:hypothetical protein
VCPAGKAVCLGGSDIGPGKGYWRKSNMTYEFLECPVKDACLGMNINLPILTPGNQVGMCNVREGYYGTLCSACMPGYKREGNFSCEKCQPHQIYIMGGVFFTMIFVLCFLIRSTINGADKANNTHSVFNKILMNHMQMLIITASFDLDWPELVKMIFDLAAPIK